MCTHLPLHESLAILTHWSMFQQLLCILSLDTPRWLVTRSWKNRGSKLGPKSTGYSSRWRDLLIHRQLHMPHQLIWMMNLLWHLTSKFWSQWSEWLSTYFYSSIATQQACDVLLKTWTNYRTWAWRWQTFLVFISTGFVSSTYVQIMHHMKQWSLKCLAQKVK